MKKRVTNDLVLDLCRLHKTPGLLKVLETLLNKPQYKAKTGEFLKKTFKNKVTEQQLFRIMKILEQYNFVKHRVTRTRNRQTNGREQNTWFLTDHFLVINGLLLHDTSETLWDTNQQRTNWDTAPSSVPHHYEFMEA